MAIFHSEDRLRQKQQRADRAINLAMQNRWSEAAELNREIIQDFPRDVDGHVEPSMLLEFRPRE